MKLVTALTALALGLSTSALAQVGSSQTQLVHLPELTGFKASGNTLLAPDGSRITLTQRRGLVTSAQVSLPNADAAQAGKLLGALTGYGTGLAQAYTDYLKDPKNQAALLAGTTINAQQFQVTNKLSPLNTSSGSQQRLTFTVTLPEVPESKFATTKNVIGKAGAPVVLRIYSDFQCPYCEQFETQTWPSVQKALGKSLGEGVRYEFHQFPLEQIHPNARAAAEASECAAQQGKFWPYHDTLFDPQHWQIWTQAANPNPNFISYAQGLKLNLAPFKECLAERGGKANVDAGIKDALNVGVNGTPTVFVNGLKVANPYDIAGLLKMIQAAQEK